MSDYRKLKVWGKAHLMALDVSKVAPLIRSADHKSLRSQLIRAALSVPTNIVEGGGQRSWRDRIRYLRYSENSANETEYHCLIARDLGILDPVDHDRIAARIEEIRRMLSGLIKKIERDGDRVSDENESDAG